MGNLKWKLALCVIGLAALMGAGLMASGTPVLSAPATCTITVDIPDELNTLGAKIDYYPWSRYRTDGQQFTADQGSTVNWIFIVNGFSGKGFNFKVPAAATATLTVEPDAYCTMKVINVPNGGKVNVYPWNTYWTNNQEIVVPISGSCTWRLIVNGFTGSDTYIKHFDCTALDVTKAVKIVKSYCDMTVQMDAGLPDTARVNVYPWNTYWKNTDVITVPVSGSCKWKLIVSGFSGKEYTKNFDCSPLVVNGSHYCTMTVINVPDGYKVCVYPWNTYWDNSTVLAVPIGGSCNWKLVKGNWSGPTYTKNFDCNPLDASVSPTP